MTKAAQIHLGYEVGAGEPVSGFAPRADEACKKLLTMGFLTREEDGFKAVPGMKANLVEV